DGCRPLDHLAGGDLVDKLGGKFTDGHGRTWLPKAARLPAAAWQANARRLSGRGISQEPSGMTSLSPTRKVSSDLPFTWRSVCRLTLYCRAMPDKVSPRRTACWRASPPRPCQAATSVPGGGLA